MDWLKEQERADLNSQQVTDNAGGLEVFEDDDWAEWLDDEGRDILAVIDDEEDG